MAVSANEATTVVGEVAKSAPPLTAVGLTIAGVSLQDWMYIVVVGYTVLQAYVLIRDKIVRDRNGKDGSD